MGGDDYVAVWLARLRPGARVAYRRTLMEFARYVGVDCTRLVQEARLNHGFDMLRTVQAYVDVLPGPKARAQWTYAALRSFLAISRASLPRDFEYMLQLNGGSINDC